MESKDKAIEELLTNIKVIRTGRKATDRFYKHTYFVRPDKCRGRW
jgi:hypothetical protein